MMLREEEFIRNARRLQKIKTIGYFIMNAEL